MTINSSASSRGEQKSGQRSERSAESHFVIVGSLGRHQSAVRIAVSELSSAKAALLVGFWGASALAETGGRLVYRAPQGCASAAEFEARMAIEALAAEGDRATLAERIARFLARYPSDPHAARVRALAP